MKAKLVFGSLYAAQGLAGGFIASALVQKLVEGGMSKADVGELLAAVSLPWVIKPAWGPLVDRGSKIHAIILAALVMAAILVGLPMVGTGGLAIAVFFFRLAGSAQDVAVDGLAVERLAPADRGPVQSTMKIGAYLGFFAGGAGMIALSGTISWPIACWITAAAILVTSVIPTLALTKTSTSAEKHVEEKAEPPTWREFISAFRGMTPVAGVVLGLLAFAGQGLTEAITFPWFKSLGYDREIVATLLTWNQIVRIGGALLGGYVAAKTTPKIALVAATCMMVASYGTIGAMNSFWPNIWVIWGLIGATALADGMYSVTLCTLFMAITNKRVATTQYAIYMAALNASVAGTSYYGGHLAEVVGLPLTFLIGGVGQIVVLIPLIFIRLPRKEEKVE